MLIRDVIANGVTALTDSYTPELDATLLMEHLLQVGQGEVQMDGTLTAEQLAVYDQLIGRAKKLEPIPYITNRAYFRYLQLYVAQGVLIPRPETELLVEMVLDWAAGRPSPRVVDVGSGSGCIAIALATEAKEMRVEAVEFSADAHPITTRNIQDTGADVVLYHGSLLEPIIGKLDAVVANLPYITEVEWATVDSAVKLYEPSIALLGGEDGLDLINDLLHQAIPLLKPDGAIFLGIGWQQGANCVALAKKIFPNATVICHQDYTGHDRIITIQNHLA